MTPELKEEIIRLIDERIVAYNKTTPNVTIIGDEQWYNPSY
jgi:hypothetical protein